MAYMVSHITPVLSSHLLTLAARQDPTMSGAFENFGGAFQFTESFSGAAFSGEDCFDGEKVYIDGLDEHDGFFEQDTSAMATAMVSS
jgi:hypothetical protein